MPELPEVETMCRGIAPILSRQVLGVERPPCTRRPISIRPRMEQFHKRAVGKNVAAIERLGKRVVIWLGSKTAGAEAIVIEPRMTGLVLLADPPTREHLRFRLRLSGKSKLDLLFWDRRGLGTVRLFSAQEFAAEFHTENGRLGPDALQLSADEIASAFIAAAEQSRWPCWINERSPASEICTPPKYCTLQKSIPQPAAIGCAETIGIACKPPRAKSSNWPSAMKAPPWPMARIATL